MPLVIVIREKSIYSWIWRRRITLKALIITPGNKASMSRYEYEQEQLAIAQKREMARRTSLWAVEVGGNVTAPPLKNNEQYRRRMTMQQHNQLMQALWRRY